MFKNIVLSIAFDFYYCYFPLRGRFHAQIVLTVLVSFFRMLKIVKMGGNSGKMIHRKKSREIRSRSDCLASKTLDDGIDMAGFKAWNYTMGHYHTSNHPGSLRLTAGSFHSTPKDFCVSRGFFFLMRQNKCSRITDSRSDFPCFHQKNRELISWKLYADLRQERAYRGDWSLPDYRMEEKILQILLCRLWVSRISRPDFVFFVFDDDDDASKNSFVSKWNVQL